jgi:hypothetical protein
VIEEQDKTFTDPEEWRLEVYRQQGPSIKETYEQKKTEDDVGIFLLDLNDPIARQITSSLIKDFDGNENTIIVLVRIETFLQYVRGLATKKCKGFQIGGLSYKEENEVPVCVIAANGATFFAVQNLK